MNGLKSLIFQGFKPFFTYFTVKNGNEYEKYLEQEEKKRKSRKHLIVLLFIMIAILVYGKANRQWNMLDNAPDIPAGSASVQVTNGATGEEITISDWKELSDFQEEIITPYLDESLINRFDFSFKYNEKYEDYLYKITIFQGGYLKNEEPLTYFITSDDMFVHDWIKYKLYHGSENNKFDLEYLDGVFEE